MSYQVLARKWRPHTFSEMVGQSHVLKALINALDQQRLHHAYLFTGTRGVGKTTLARIIAKCLNCERGVSSKPCGQCSTCRAIDEGRFVDLIEVDAASRTKVEDTRELLDNVQYAPTAGRYKVYLIDEAHMLSSHSFNALLKTLEEPPPHVKFLLATTDPQKLPVTILSRCLQFALKSLSPDQIVDHLAHVLHVEAIPFELDALWLLGRAADGSMRDALTLTDQAIAFGDGRISATDVRAMLGSLDHGQIYELLQALLAANPRSLLAAVQHLSEQGIEWGAVLAELLNVLHRIAIAQVLPDAVDNAQGDRERILALAQQLPGEDVQFYYQLGLIGRRDLPLAPDPRSGFEMVLLRMLAFRPASVAGGPTTELQTTPPDVDEASVPNPEPSAWAPAPSMEGWAPDAPVERTEPPTATINPCPEVPRSELLEKPPSSAVILPFRPTAIPVATLASPDADAAYIPPWEEAPQATVDTSPVAALESEEEGEPFDSNYFRHETSEVDFDWPLTSGADVLADAPAPDDVLAVSPATGLAADWINLLPQLGLSGLTANIAANCTLVAVEGQNWTLHLDPKQSALFNSVQQERLNTALNLYHNQELRLTIQLSTPQQETPAQAAARARLVRQRQAERSIQDDPRIQQLKTRFSAVVREHSIEPLTTTT